MNFGLHCKATFLFTGMQGYDFRSDRSQQCIAMMLKGPRHLMGPGSCHGKAVISKASQCPEIDMQMADSGVQASMVPPTAEAAVGPDAQLTTAVRDL